MSEQAYNSIIVLGPTAVGKTALAVRIADTFNGEIISADSRQVYRHLDIGSGKDICEFTLDNPERTIPYHLIDVVSLPDEYSVFNYQQGFYQVFPEIISRKKVPVVCGGTGMYLDAVVRGYKMNSVPCNAELRKKLQGKSVEELASILTEMKNGKLHNTTDILEHHRLLRAIEIETYNQEHPENAECSEIPPETFNRPDIRPFIIGTTFPREKLRSGIKRRLSARFEEGMIDEVASIHASGVLFERLERLGLEYKFISWYLQKKLSSFDELYDKLYIAIGQFAKRQETWFRHMEKQGVKINWLSCDGSEESFTVESRLEEASKLLCAQGFTKTHSGK